MRVLVVTAVDAERAAITALLPDSLTADPSAHSVISVGVGPAAAAAGTARALALGSFDLVLSAGIGGGFAPLVPSMIAVASRAVFADLGAETDAGFTSASELGFGVDRYDVEPGLAVELADRCGGHLGTILTVATVTGTAARADALVGRYPDAIAEGMEGAGVAAAAGLSSVPWAEVRAISNAVGPRDRRSWRTAEALDALGRAIAAILAAA